MLKKNKELEQYLTNNTNDTQYRIYNFLSKFYRFGESFRINSNRLCECFGLKRQAVSNNLKKLVQKGLLEDSHVTGGKCKYYLLSEKWKEI